jgi:hypothetical protein
MKSIFTWVAAAGLIFGGGLLALADEIPSGPRRPSWEDWAKHEIQQKKETPAPVYAIAGTVVAVTTFGSLAAIYFIRKRNDN